jgi:hypothetical protein
MMMMMMMMMMIIIIISNISIFTAVTMKNAVFWDIKPSSYLTGDTLRLRFRAQQVNAM